MALVQLATWIFWFLCALFRDRVELATENLVYRQQLVIDQQVQHMSGQLMCLPTLRLCGHYILQEPM